MSSSTSTSLPACTAAAKLQPRSCRRTAQNVVRAAGPSVVACAPSMTCAICQRAAPTRCDRTLPRSVTLEPFLRGRAALRLSVHGAVDRG